MDSERQDWDSNPGSEIQIKFQDPSCKPLWFITLHGRADKKRGRQEELWRWVQ